MTNPFYAEIYNLHQGLKRILCTLDIRYNIEFCFSETLISDYLLFRKILLMMSGLSVMRIVRPAMRGLMGSPQLQSQMVVRMMSSQKELQYIKVDTTG